ncbi:MAG: hypothetical protein J1F40_06750 [Prevotellaceae bacterium]|nr:hypothetical protein [Prevotellaceae bacterium]
MKKKLFIIFGVFLLMSCGHKEKTSIQKWEYKVLKFCYGNLINLAEKEERSSVHAVVRDNLIPLEDSLSVLGKDGWELISTYTTISTSFPNFGDDKYVTGIREQTATRALTAILKRPYLETSDKGKTKKSKEK